MGSPAEDWPVCVDCVFVLHRVFTQNTWVPLRTRSAHPSNLLCRQRHSVPPRTACHPEWPSGHTEEAAISHAKPGSSISVLPETLFSHRGSNAEGAECPACQASGCPVKGQTGREQLQMFLCSYTSTVGCLGTTISQLIKFIMAATLSGCASDITCVWSLYIFFFKLKIDTGHLNLKCSSAQL